MVGSQSPESQVVRRPMCEIWHISAVPWRWMRRAKSRKAGTTVSEPTKIWP